MTKDPMLEPVRRMTSITFRIEAAEKEFLAAHVVNNLTEAADLRERVRTLVDAKLDAIADIATLAREGRS